MFFQHKCLSWWLMHPFICPFFHSLFPFPFYSSCGAGEEGKMAHRHVETSQDSMPRLFAPGSMASTAFWHYTHTDTHTGWEQNHKVSNTIWMSWEYTVRSMFFYPITITKTYEDQYNIWYSTLYTVREVAIILTSRTATLLNTGQTFKVS